MTLFFGALGLACTAVIVASAADSVSPLLALPVIALAATFVPARRVRTVAAVAMCARCCVAAASVGMFLVPCAVGMVAIARRTA